GGRRFFAESRCQARAGPVTIHCPHGWTPRRASLLRPLQHVPTEPTHGRFPAPGARRRTLRGAQSMFGLGMSEVLVVLLIGLLLSGSKLPELARGLGKALAESRHEAGGLSEDLRAPLK